MFIPAALLAHYAEDYVKHWDVGTGLTNGSRKRSHAFIAEIGDLALAGMLVLAMYPVGGFSSVWSYVNMGGITALLHHTPVWGAFFGLLPDFMEAPRNFLKKEPLLLRPLNRFHHAVHRSIPNVVRGLAPQIVLVALLWIFR